MLNSVALLLIWLPAIVIGLAWWQIGRSKSAGRTGADRLYLISVIAQSVSCLTYLAGLYFRIVQLSTAPFFLLVLSFMAVVLCLTTALLLVLFGNGSFRYFLAISALWMSWSLLRTIGVNRAYWLALALPLFWALLAWMWRFMTLGSQILPPAASFAMLAGTASVLLALALVLYTRFVTVDHGLLFTSVAVGSIALCVIGAITALFAIRKGKNWFGLTAIFLSLWMLSIWMVVWSRL